jgi:hypothetical protein
MDEWLKIWIAQQLSVNENLLIEFKENLSNDIGTGTGLQTDKS